MQTENWKTIKELLLEVLRLEPVKRREFLETVETTDEVLAEVESLLALEAESENFMSLSLPDYSKDFVAETEGISPVGQRVGIYKIVGELGFGGMGAVYLAQREDGKFEQQVAIKMLKREYNVERIRRRFAREKEIQAKINHPNVARLLDAGRCADGVPFLVMEYVAGVPVDKYCARENLSLKARLKLFNRFCEAVGFAHRSLIVHRDLKPSNILVTEKGEPKLLDFGISKLLDADGADDKTAVTALGAMTPEYASPEQVRGEAVTTATDVYSLGVILFKILTGSYPYDFKNKSNGNLLKEITDSEPTLASAALREEKTRRQKDDATVSQAEILSDGQNKIAPSHRPAISSSELKGDLDNIILKSLSKEPARRYQSVEQFSADIWRYLDGLPVAARPATASYRASKYLQRNKLAVASAALIFLSLIGGTAVASWQAREANAQANLAIESQRKSDGDKEKAEKISRFMFKVFSYANPQWFAEGYKSGGQARVFDALDDLSGKIESEFPEQADVRAELHHRFAEVYGGVWRSNTEPARRAEIEKKVNFHTCRALELRRQFYGEWHELVAKDLYFGQHCVAGDDEAKRAEVMNRAIRMMRDTNPNNLNFPYMLNHYAVRLVMPEQAANHDFYRQAFDSPTGENKYEIAERYLRESLPVYRQHYKEDNISIWATECQIAYVLAVQNKWTDFDAPYAACQKNEAQIKQHYASGGAVNPTPLDWVEKVLAEKKNLE